MHPNIDGLIHELQAHQGKLRRFGLFIKDKHVAFPEFVSAEVPTSHDHKQARKRVAQLARDNEIVPGQYDLAAAKKILNTLRDLLVSEINSTVQEFSYEPSICFLLTRIDALIADYEHKRAALGEASKHETEYSPDQTLAETHSSFVGEHRHYRYLIEKFVQLQPQGVQTLDSNSFRSLIALIDKLHEVYSASDHLHYELYPLGIEIDSDYLVHVVYQQNVDQMQNEYGKGQAQQELGLIGNEADRVGLPEPIELLLSMLDEAFETDLGFGLRNLANVLQLMAGWAFYRTDSAEAPYYSATLETVAELASEMVEDLNTDNVPLILAFLTLDPAYVLTTTDNPEPARDLPIWEYNKRLHRYMLKPLIFINGRYYWGPYSAERSGKIWVNSTHTGSLPAQIEAPNVNRVLKENQAKLDKSLELKALEIVKRYTPYAERVNYDRGTHSQELGEYDVLAYLPTNILLNIECKDIGSAYVLKDAKRLREKIFRPEYEGEKKVKNPGNLVIVEKREAYLASNIDRFRDSLKWPIGEAPTIVSLYITRQDYWWTKFPPRPTTVRFLRIELLDEFIKDLLR